MSEIVQFDYVRPERARASAIVEVSVAMRETIEKFSTHQRLAGLSAKTIRRRRISIRLLARHAQARLIDQISRDHVESWLIDYEVAATRRSYLGDARAFWKWAVERGHTEADPTTGIPTPRVPKRLPTPLTTEEVARVVLACRGRQDDRAVGLGVHAGLRVSEIAALAADEIDLNERVLIVRNGKGGKDRSVPISNPLMRLLDNVSGDVVRCNTGEGVSQRIKRVYEQAGIEGHRPHDLRATFATELLRQTGNIKLAAELLGHSSIATTERYALLDPPGAEVLDQMYGMAA